MKTAGKSRRGGAMFQKDPDVLPFFSIHPKTKAGMILRIALSVFCMLALVITFLASRGIMLIWYQKLSFLLYIVPLVGLILLIALALYKRMKTSFTKIAVPGLILFFASAIVMTLGSMMSFTSDFALVPKMLMENDGHTVVLMRACAEPDGTVTETDEEGYEVTRFPIVVDAYRYTVRVPETHEGYTYDITGEILIPADESIEFEIKEEWTDADTLRLYIAKDTSEMGIGEIVVSFKEGETKPAGDEMPDSEIYRNSFENGGHKVSLYRGAGQIQTTVNSPYMMSEEDFIQVFFAYPRTMYAFAKINTRTEGNIYVEPKGSLEAINWEWLEEDKVARLTPSETSTGATGSITIYFDETVDPKAADEVKDAETDAASPAEAAE